jgi:hypothetical protein
MHAAHSVQSCGWRPGASSLCILRPNGARGRWRSPVSPVLGIPVKELVQPRDELAHISSLGAFSSPQPPPAWLSQAGPPTATSTPRYRQTAQRRRNPYPHLPQRCPHRPRRRPAHICAERPVRSQHHFRTPVDPPRQPELEQLRRGHGRHQTSDFTSQPDPEPEHRTAQVALAANDSAGLTPRPAHSSTPAPQPA